MNDPLEFYGQTFTSRFMIGTARYPSPELLTQSITASGAEILTVSLRRESAMGKEGQAFWELVQNTGLKILPNTAGCSIVKEAVTTAQMAREVFGTNWIKLEVIGNPDTLQPDMFGTVEAAQILIKDGFEIFPYITEDLIAAERLVEAGCKVLMPWASPIGSGRGLSNPIGLKLMREKFPDVVMVVDAGIGSPSHAVQAMELGYDATLINSAIGKSGNPPLMAEAFSHAVKAGRLGYLSKPIPPKEKADTSTPMAGKPQLA